MRDYPDKLDDGKITWFAIHNVRKKLDKSAIMNRIDDKTELSEVALDEFNKIMKDGATKAEEIYNEAKSQGELGIAIKGLEQIRRNWVSMMDYYMKHIIPPIENVTINEDKKVIVVLQRWNELICPNCKERIHRELLLNNEK
jgi:hypothetical protein